MVTVFNDISDRIERDQREHAMALQRITALEKEVFECKDVVVVVSKDHQRAIKLLKYLETHDGITTTAAMKLVNVSHHQSVHRAMIRCVENDGRLVYTKTAAGKRILKKK